MTAGGRHPSAVGRKPAPLLRIANLSLRIGSKRVLDDVSLDMAPGEILALTGESGSGKSMTALSVMGLLPGAATATGTVALNGEDLLPLPDRAMNARRGCDIGMVFQEPMTALNPFHRIGDQVAETLRIHRAMPRGQARAQAALTLARTGLDPAQVSPARYPHELSGGQRQRVVIAMAIAMRPRLLIADEPTTALDVTTQAQILDLLTGLVRDDGMGMLLITHDLAVVAQHADRIAVMKDGAIVEMGATGQVLAQRSHPYTQALFDASSYRPALAPRAPGAPLLVARDVVRSYAGARKGLRRAPAIRAVDGVSLTIASGERVGLVGESGCGKSTLTRAILGLEPLQGGSITIGGQPVGTPATRRQMQAVFQDPYGSFNPRHRVGRLVSEPCHLTGLPPGDPIGPALTEVGLSPEDARRHIHAFSGGQRQRIAIARALIIRPELVIFDEAVSALDVRVRARILDLIALLTDRHGLTSLFISHDLSVVRGVTDRVLVMKSGKIVEQGPTGAVFDAPQHPYTRMLLDAAPRLPGGA